MILVFIAGLSLRFHVADNAFSRQEIKQLENSFVFYECYQAVSDSLAIVKINSVVI